MIKIKILKFWEIFYHNVGQIIKIIKILWKIKK
jgi:hypothetical protein